MCRSRSRLAVATPRTIALHGHAPRSDHLTVSISGPSRIGTPVVVGAEGSSVVRKFFPPLLGGGSDRKRSVLAPPMATIPIPTSTSYERSRLIAIWTPGRAAVAGTVTRRGPAPVVYLFVMTSPFGTT